MVLEPEHVSLGSEPFNARWIRQLYGARLLKELKNLTVSCSGTTLGTRAGIRRYLVAMVKDARHSRPMGSHDQGDPWFLASNRAFDPVYVAGKRMWGCVDDGFAESK